MGGFGSYRELDNGGAVRIEGALKIFQSIISHPLPLPVSQLISRGMLLGLRTEGGFTGDIATGRNCSA